MSVINTNINSLVAQNAATVNNRAMSKTMEQLSTGKRINGAADDAAGLAISNKMTAQIRGLNQAVRNANDGISMIQTAESATQEVGNMLQRMRELAVQAATDSYSADDRGAVNKEVAELSKEIIRIANNTQWNNMGVSGSAAATNFGSAKFHVGANNGQVITAGFKNLKTLTGMVSSLIATTTTIATANSALTSIDLAIKNLSAYRADLGAKVNRLTYAADNLATVSLNISASRSRIEDTDYAEATTELARTQIIQQAATAMLAQANQAPQSVLSLLR